MAKDNNESGYLRNAELARFLRVSVMTVWNWQRDPDLGFPQPAVINNICYTSRAEVDKWLRSKVKNLAKFPDTPPGPPRGVAGRAAAWRAKRRKSSERRHDDELPPAA